MSQNYKEYHYINDLGLHKKLVVDLTPVDGKYATMLWCTDNGEWCGYSEKTAEEINEYLKHYGIAERFVEEPQNKQQKEVVQKFGRWQKLSSDK